MKRTILTCCVLAFLVLQTCNPAPATLPIQNLALPKGQPLSIDMDSGALELSGTDEATVQVSGEAPSMDDRALQVASEANGVHIRFKTPSRWFWQPRNAILHLSVRVPRGAAVNINTFDTGIDVQDFTGNMTITAVSGDITIRNSQGNFAIQSNRGNVTTETTRGELHVAGNYGVLSMVNAHGVLGAATIMGTVRFVGPIGARDNVNLETDHGPVEMQLASDSDVTVQVRTTSGVITCTMPGVQYAGQGCAGTLGAGKGQLDVRTVSGSVTLGQQP